MPTNENDIILKDEERQQCEVWTRVMGYFRPSSEFNLGKKSEFAERKYFKESNALKNLNELEKFEHCDCMCHSMEIAAE